ncbi:MAG: hypothetical protein GX481_08630, partial [Atopobium sp.]|nr:hypothetical protein [Atopobium sp.]
MISMGDDRQGIVSVKSYISFQAEHGTREIYSVSAIDNSTASFLFELPLEHADYVWRANSDFSYRIDQISIEQNNVLLNDKTTLSEDALFYSSSFSAKKGKLLVKCLICPMNLPETIDWIRSEYGNRCAHINQLIQNERKSNQENLNLENGYRTLEQQYNALVIKSEKSEDININLNNKITDLETENKKIKRAINLENKAIEELNQKVIKTIADDYAINN